MATERRIIWRFQPEGGAELVSTIKRGEDAGVHAATAIAGATERATAAAERQEAQWRRNAEAIRAAASATPLQSQIDRSVGVTGGGNARASAAARTLFAADDAAMARAAQLKAEIDPAAAALDRYNRELADFAALQKRGAISTLEMAKAQELAKSRLDATTAALGRQTGGITRQMAASRLNLARQGADVLTTAAMGMNPAMILVQQGPQVLDAMATSGLRASAGMLALGGAVAVAAGAVAALGVSYLQAEDRNLALDRAATGLGRVAGLTADQLKGLAREGALAADISVSAAEKQAAAFVSTGRIGGEVLGDLIGLSRDYARFMGVDAAEATASLATAMADPVAAAKQWTRDFGLADQATIRLIESMVKQGEQSKAQEILVDALADAVRGQTGKVSELTSAWDALGRVVSNVWTGMGEAMWVTTAERLVDLDTKIVRERELLARDQGRGVNADWRQNRLSALEGQRGSLIQQQMDEEAKSRTAATNAAAQRAVDRTPRPPRARADRSGEREAREAETRRRAAEDRAAMLELEMTRALGDVDHVRVLEDEAALRERIRQLVDADVEAGEARTTALREQGQLLAARAIVTERETMALFRANAIEVDRIEGMTRYVAESERAAELNAQIAAYVKAGQGYYAAWLKASSDQLNIEEARAVVLARIVASAADEHQLTLARMAGREAEVQLLERAERIANRAREIEGREKLNYGEGDDRARVLIGQEDEAKAEGVRRTWVKSFIDDIRSGGIKDALASQFESAADRLIDKLIDSLFEIDFGAIMGGGKGGGGGGWLGSLFSALFGGFGRNARGTDWWPGGPSWVGEEGPELVNLPRGAQVIDADRSRRLAVAGASGTAAAQAVSFSFAPVIHAEGAGPREIDALSAKMDAMAASLPSVVPQIVQDAMNRRLIR